MNESIDISGQSRYFSAEEFKQSAKDLYRMIMALVRGNDVPTEELANRLYFLEWLLEEVEIKCNN